MTTLTYIAWLSAAFSVSSFVVFLLAAWQKILDIRIAQRALALKLGEAKSPVASMDTAAQGAFLEAPEKLLEAAAKLTDSLAKAPLTVVALVGSMLFLVIAAGAAELGCHACAETGKPPPKPTAALIPGQRCVVGFFDDGDHQLPAALHDSPAGCLNRLGMDLRRQRPGLLMMIGRCDVRELRPRVRRRYGDNQSLAYQRAASVRDYLLAPKDGAWPAATDTVISRAVLLVGGAAQPGGRLQDASRYEDRVVELMPFWIDG